MALRLLTSGVGLIVFFVLLFMNETVFSIAVGIVTLGMVYEAVRTINAGKSITIVSLCYSAVISAAVLLAMKITEATMMMILVMSVVLIGMFAYMILTVIFFEKKEIYKIYSSAFITAYLSFFMSFIALARYGVGRYGVILVFLFAWITDSGAYFAGRLFGKRKLAPNLSPKKTVEGAIGGVIATMLGTVIYIIVMKTFYNVEFYSNVLLVVASIGGAVLSELGDLAASALKRNCGVKDFGKIFPGHGGFLDRFDSVVFVAPYAFLLLALPGLLL